jgi:alpha-aminoadipate carrier protein LysW
MALPDKKMLVAECPECETKIRFPQAPQMGETLTCHECGEALQVVSLSPLELDWANDDDYGEWEEDEEWEEEEWEDDEDDEFEDDEED